MKKIALHDNILSVRGTTVAIYDYAFYLEKNFDYECIILYNLNYNTNNEDVILKFSKHFKVFGYRNIEEIDEILLENQIEYFFAIKSGQKDGVISKVCKNLIMAVSSRVTKNDIHGDKFFVCSPWLSKVTGIDYVPHMINLPFIEGDLRSEFGIPDESIVFGRNGGYETFDIEFAKQAVRDVLYRKENYYFIFQNTERFIEHERVIYLDSNPDLEYKVKFINTCDALLHARHIGESFGLTCGEFSIKNKPVITWNGSPERNHIMTLGDKGLFYNNYQELMAVMLNFDVKKFDDWNCYNDFLPEKVICKFNQNYFDI